MTLTNVSWAPTQFGFHTGGLWTEAVGGLGSMFLTPTNSLGGITFDAGAQQGFRFANVGSDTRLLDGPVVASFALSFLAQRDPLANPPFVLEFALQATPTPTNYANGAAPFSLGETSLGTFTLTDIPVAPASLAFTFTFSTAQADLARAMVTSRSRWNGRLSLSVQRVGGTGLVTLFSANDGTVAMETTQELFFAGRVGGGDGRLRAVRDGRFAMPAWNTDLVRDGDQPGLWVRPEDWDPEDPEKTYRPRPGEGSVDDEIPNL